jgi:uncharacterized protein (DUF1697 family)
VKENMKVGAGVTTYIALLRGINVGGHHIVKMAELKRMFELLGFLRVQTYIQSGNVLFESIEAEVPLRERIEREFASTFGFASVIILRTAAEMERIIENCPFSEEAIFEAQATSEGECLHVAMLPEAPSQEGIERLSEYRNENEEFRIVGRDVYLMFQRSLRNSRLAGSLNKLGVPATMRNWKTMNKLAQLGIYSSS